MCSRFKAFQSLMLQGAGFTKGFRVVPLGLGTGIAPCFGLQFLQAVKTKLLVQLQFGAGFPYGSWKARRFCMWAISRKDGGL